MKTEALMPRSVATCSANDTLDDAAHLMWDRDVGCVVVTDSQRKPIGMIPGLARTLAIITERRWADSTAAQ